jgi:hypothetical protein
VEENENVGQDEGTQGRGGEELALVREVVLKAHPDAVPELIGGETIADLLASVEPARAAYARISERQRPAGETPPTVPAGAATAVVDPATLPSHELIRRGIEAGKRVRR